MRRVAIAAAFPALLLLVGLLILSGACAPLRVTPTPAPYLPRPLPSPAPTVTSQPSPYPPPSPRPATPTVTPPPLTLAAIFASWYGYDDTGECTGGLGSYHWNNTPDMAGVTDLPERGYYCSADPETIEWQLDGLERAGVQALFVSWWGWGDADLDGEMDPTPHPDAYMEKGITALLDHLATVSDTHPISVSLIVEPFYWTQAPETPVRPPNASQRATLLDHLWAKYYGNEKYRNLWFQWDGKPLLIAFDPMSITMPISSTYPISYTVRNWTGRAKDDKTVEEGWQWFFAPPQDPVGGMSSDGVTFVYPRFDEVPLATAGATYITWTPRSIDPLLTECAYETQWTHLAEHRSQVRMVVLYGWNLYGEQAYIEPATATPPRPSTGYDYVDRTRRYFEELADGGTIVPVSPCPTSP